MALQITPEQEKLVQVIFRTGGFDSETDVLSSALEMLQQQQQLSIEVREGFAVLDRGEFTEYTASDRERFRADIAAEAARRKEVAES